MLELRCHDRLFQHGAVAFPDLGRRNVADVLQQPAIDDAAIPMISPLCCRFATFMMALRYTRKH